MYQAKQNQKTGANPPTPFKTQTKTYWLIKQGNMGLLCAYNTGPILLGIFGKI